MRLLVGVLALAPFCVPLYAQERGDNSDLAVVGRIKAEAFENSQVMDTLEYLTDQYGPRLTASPEWRQAADWAVKRLQGYGLENVHIEKWGSPARGWTLKHAALEMLEPRYSALIAAPLAWSHVTSGEQTAEVVLAQYGSGRSTPDPKVSEDELAKFESEWKGKLKGKIVMLSPARKVEVATKPDFTRYTNQELSEIAEAPAPAVKVPVDPNNLKFPDDPQEALAYFLSLPAYVREGFAKRRQAVAAKRAAFLGEEGVVALLDSNQWSHNGFAICRSCRTLRRKRPLGAADIRGDAGTI